MCGKFEEHIFSTKINKSNHRAKRNYDDYDDDGGDVAYEDSTAAEDYNDYDYDTRRDDSGYGSGGGGGYDDGLKVQFAGDSTRKIIGSDAFPCWISGTGSRERPAENRAAAKFYQSPAGHFGRTFSFGGNKPHGERSNIRYRRSLVKLTVELMDPQLDFVPPFLLLAPLLGLAALFLAAVITANGTLITIATVVNAGRRRRRRRRRSAEDDHEGSSGKNGESEGSSINLQ